jgi:hypothetical protein
MKLDVKLVPLLNSEEFLPKILAKSLAAPLCFEELIYANSGLTLRSGELK